MVSKFKFDCPDDALLALADRLRSVGVESAFDQLVGRTLATDVNADRDSPAADVSAMDGYALRMEDLRGDEPIPVSGESSPGSPPPSSRPGAAVRIFTGAIVPEGCEVVIKREDTEELDDAVRFLDSALKTARGEHIRRAGENARAGSPVLSTGTRVAAAQHATMANFGAYHSDVFARVRASIITSGNEVGLFRDQPPTPWQLRNSNRFSITSVLSRPWVDLVATEHSRDDPDQLSAVVGTCLEKSDAVILSGGVSMGDYDYVPDVVKRLGGEIVFHGLPIRPGKPILGAATSAGKLILGLPGNPVSATVGCHRFGIPLLAKMGGDVQWNRPRSVVRLQDAGDRTIPLHWMRLVRLTADGIAVPVISQGSGDLVSLGQSSGYVEIPPNLGGEGPWPFHDWQAG